MKKTAAGFFIFGALYLLAPSVTTATTFQMLENYSLRKGDAVSGDLYAIGSSATVAGNVSGDLVSAGFDVYVGGNTITESVLIFADTAHVISDVGGTLRMVSRNIFVSSTVGRDAALAGWTIDILPQSVIGGDLLAAGGNVTVSGRVHGSAHIAGGSVYINGIIAGDVSIMANHVSLGPNAVISGNLSYSASDPALIENGAKIGGSSVFTQINTRSRAERFLPTVWGTLAIVKFAVFLLSALIAHGILRRVSERFVVVSISEFGLSLLRGFLLFIAVPVVAFIATLTLVALPFSLFALALYGIGLLLSLVYAPIVIGSLIRKGIRRDEPIKVTWKTILLGEIVAVALGYLPYIGGFVWYGFVLVALGGIYQVLFDKFIEVR